MRSTAQSRRLLVYIRHRAMTDSMVTRKRRRVFTGRQRPKTLTTSFGFTAQTRRLRQPRPAAAAAADQNSLKFGRWGRWKPKESQDVVVAAAAGGWCLKLVRGWAGTQLIASKTRPEPYLKSFEELARGLQTLWKYEQFRNILINRKAMKI